MEKANWSAIYALALGVSGLMIAEYLPAGVLTPMSRDLGITEGMAGQSITATAIFAVIASLLIAYVSRKYNRKSVLLSLSSLLTISSLIVAFSTNFTILMIGRAFLGIALGGFWAMSTAIAIRLVPSKDVAKALSIIFSSAAFAAILAAPLGSFLGDIVGWRNVFLFAALIGTVGFTWQVFTMPTLSPIGEVKFSTTLDVLKIPNFVTGLLAISLAFCGRFASFTYLRPFLEQTTGLSGNSVSFAFLAFDAAYFLGSLNAAQLVKKDLFKTLAFPPLVLAACTLGLVLFGKLMVPTFVLVFILGASFAPVPVAWSTWTASVASDNTETAGGLYVGAVQASAAVGALVGGVAFDARGASGVFVLSGVSWVLSTVLVLWKIKKVSRDGLILGTAH